MEGAPAPAPIDGASNVPAPADPNLPSDVPPASEEGGDIAQIGPDQPNPGAPGANGAEGGAPDGNGELDPMGPPAEEGAPDMDGGEDLGAEPENGGEEDDDSTVSIINKLTPEDREAVRSYAQSMLSRSEANAEEGPEGEEPIDNGGEAPIAESFVFTKGQLKKIHENLLPTEPEKEKNQIEKKRSKALSDKSPFKSPKFN